MSDLSKVLVSAVFGVIAFWIVYGLMKTQTFTKRWHRALGMVIIIILSTIMTIMWYS